MYVSRICIVCRRIDRRIYEAKTWLRRKEAIKRWKRDNRDKVNLMRRNRYWKKKLSGYGWYSIGSCSLNRQY